MTHIVRRQAAHDDLIEQYVYIGRRSEDAAERFIDAAEQTMRHISEHPRAGSPARLELSGLGDVRYSAIEGFRNHLIFYRPLTDGIEVLRVLHAARDLPNVFPAPPDPEA